MPVKSLLLSEENYDFPTTDVKTVSRSSSRSSLNNGTLVPEPDPFGLLPPIHDMDAAAGDSEEANVFAGFGPPISVTPVQPPTLYEKLTSYRLDIVVLSLLLQVLYRLSTVNVDSMYFFLPMAIHEIMKLIFLPKRPQSSIINALLMMQGISPERVQKVMVFAQLAMSVSQDFCVFLFTTICIQSLYNTLENIIVIK